MKILMFSTDKKIFEPSSAVKSRMLGYASQADELFIIVLGISKDLQTDTDGRLKILGLTRFNAFFWQSIGKFDLVTSQDPFENGFIAWRLTRRLKAKLELQIHTDIGSFYFQHESFKNRFRYFLAKLLLPKADKIRVVSQRIKNYLVSNLEISETKIYVKPIFVDIEKIKKVPITVDLHKKYSQFGQIILMASRLTKEKNIGLAIKAMCEIVKQKPKTGLIIVGSGPEEGRLKLLASSFQLLDNIIFEKWVAQETLVSYYKSCDLFLLTSLYEGYGLTLVEAQASGCKIVSTDVGVAKEIGAKIVDWNSSSLVEGIIESLK